jgi:TatA/E family protein of Tat protein translocase
MALFAFPLGGWEFLILLAIVLVLFSHRLPGAFRSLGSSVTEFKKGLNESRTNGGKDSGAREVEGRQ